MFEKRANQSVSIRAVFKVSRILGRQMLARHLTAGNAITLESLLKHSRSERVNCCISLAAFYLPLTGIPPEVRVCLSVEERSAPLEVFVSCVSSPAQIPFTYRHCSLRCHHACVDLQSQCLGISPLTVLNLIPLCWGAT